MTGISNADSMRANDRPGAGPKAVIGAPWFRQFWPVFIAVLMAVSIAASLATVVIAYRHADVDVRSVEGLGQAEQVR